MECGPLEKGIGNQYSCLENSMNSMKRQKCRTLKDELLSSVSDQYATGDHWRNNSRKNEETESKRKQPPVVDVTGEGSKVWCCSEQYCIETWNVKSMNQGKLAVVKQEMARVNIDNLGISELKWTGKGKFNSDEHYIYYCGQDSLSRNGVAIIVNKSPKWTTWVQSQKWQHGLSSFSGQTTQRHSNPSLCPNHWCWRSWSWPVPICLDSWI